MLGSQLSRNSQPFSNLKVPNKKVLQAMSRLQQLASGGGVNKWTSCVNTSSPSLPWVTAHVPVSHRVPGTRGIHRGTRRKCREIAKVNGNLAHRGAPRGGPRSHVEAGNRAVGLAHASGRAKWSREVATRTFRNVEIRPLGLAWAAPPTPMNGFFLPRAPNCKRCFTTTAARSPHSDLVRCFAR